MAVMTGLEEIGNNCFLLVACIHFIFLKFCITFQIVKNWKKIFNVCGIKQNDP